MWGHFSVKFFFLKFMSFCLFWEKFLMFLKNSYPSYYAKLVFVFVYWKTSWNNPGHFTTEEFLQCVGPDFKLGAGRKLLWGNFSKYFHYDSMICLFLYSTEKLYVSIIYQIKNKDTNKYLQFKTFSLFFRNSSRGGSQKDLVKGFQGSCGPRKTRGGHQWTQSPICPPPWNHEGIEPNC